MEVWTIILIVVIVVIFIVFLIVVFYKWYHRTFPNIPFPANVKDYSYVEFQDYKNPWPDLSKKMEKQSDDLYRKIQKIPNF
jgi:hypothetical protein